MIWGLSLAVIFESPGCLEGLAALFLYVGPGFRFFPNHSARVSLF